MYRENQCDTNRHCHKPDVKFVNGWVIHQRIWNGILIEALVNLLAPLDGLILKPAAIFSQACLPSNPTTMTALLDLKLYVGSYPGCAEKTIDREPKIEQQKSSDQNKKQDQKLLL